MRSTALSVFVSATTLALAAGLTGCASSGSGDAQQAMISGSVEAVSDTGSPIEASSAVLRVNGMSCPKCANNITLKLQELPSVNEVLINMGIGEVIVAFGDGTHPSRDQLASAIDSAGFTLESITVR